MTDRCYYCGKYIEPEEQPFSGLHASCFCSWFNIADPENFQDVAARPTEIDSKGNGWAQVTSSFFHGKFRKYSAKLGNESYLLKVQQPELPELPAMEYLCNQIAALLDLPVPPYFFIRFQNELDAFVSRNFMQDYPGADLVHIYRFLERPDQFTCTGLLQVLEQKVGRLDGIQSFITLTLFDALIGNHDRHGRNFALIHSGRNYFLAPFYDNPSYLATEIPLLLGAFHEPRGAIPTKATHEPTMRDYVVEWARLGYREVITAFMSKVDLQKIHQLIQLSFISPKRQEAFIRLTTRRMEELIDAAKKI